MLIVKDGGVVAESPEWRSPILATKRLLLVAIGGFGALVTTLIAEAILTTPILLQLITAFLALRLIKVTGMQ
ncbi:MAG: hypothetical protein U9N46_01150 [Euryarchaeota archaeon]|nr:hypothetical protein [Euryarchaeota archaeon]